jgi:glycerol-3-phosphate O-acyltransferase
MAVDALRERVQTLSRLFKYEFTFRADATFERIFDETLAAMASAGELSIDGPMVMQPDSDNVRLYVEMLRNFVEGYRVAARALSVLVRGPLAPKDIVKKAITIGERMFLAGDIQRREAVSGPLIENALSAFVDLEYVNRSDGKLELPESYASTETVRTIEAKVAGFVAPT